MDCASNFAAESASYLRDIYLPRLRLILAELRPVDVWWRPHPRATSVGNLLLHLEGNVRQWLLSGLGGEGDQRQRASEFAAVDGAPLAPLFEQLERTVLRAAELIGRLPAGGWNEPRRIQGFATTPLGAVYHVVEHFSWHLGQIAWIAKERAGAEHRLALFDDAVINQARNDPRRAPP